MAREGDGIGFLSRSVKPPDRPSPSVALLYGLFLETIMECEMCGKEVGTRRHMVDGTLMQLGACCSKYGTPLDTPQAAPAGSKAAVTQNLERRAARNTTRDVYAQETWDLVDDFGSRIRKAREQRKWDHARLGDRVSARVPQLRQIESGGLRPSDELARKMERELGITLLEKVEGGPAPSVAGASKGGKGGLTIGDILKDAMDKK